MSAAASPGALIKRPRMGSSRTMSRTCLVNLANSRSITLRISSRGSIMGAKTSSPAILCLAPTTKSFRAGVASFRPVSRKMARPYFSIDRISLSPGRPATRSERRDRHVDVFTCTARNHPVRVIWAMARAGRFSTRCGRSCSAWRPGRALWAPSYALATVATGMRGAINMLGLTKRLHARIRQDSTSEVYGEPGVHPQAKSSMVGRFPLWRHCIFANHHSHW
jgi:hypothetical protein